MADTTIYNFDQELDRSGTGSSKWGYMFAEDRDGQIKVVATDRFTGPDRCLPLWVADMDFITAKPIRDALKKRVERGIFAYTNRTEAYDSAVINWHQRHYNLTITTDDFSITPGVVPGIVQLIQTFTKPGDGIIIQTPVYFPFHSSVKNNDRTLVTNPLIYENGRFTIDYDDLAQKAADPNTTMIILCSPHNPIGRVWTAEELRRLGEICTQHNILVISDEIHCDLMLNGSTFASYGTLGPEFAQNAVICTAGSKTFNLAGLKTSNITILNPDLHAQFKNQLQNSSVAHSLNFLGQVALQAAYEDGQNWLNQVLAYLSDNCNLMVEYFENHIPEIKMVRPEGTYLAWLDCTHLNMEIKELHDFFMNKANVYLEEGNMFGEEGNAFMRLNFACPRHILQEALERIHRAVNDWRAGQN